MYQISRQFALNLRTRTDSPTEFKGDAFNEAVELSKKNENSRKMALRDSSAARIQLAFVFWDEDVMVQMLEILKDYLLADPSLPRLHNRLCFVGLAACALGQRKGSSSYLKLGQEYLSYFAKLAKQGSANAKPVHLFMLALKNPSKKSFAKTIESCAEAQTIHLEAMAKERYATYLLEEKDVEHANEYLESSYWLYQDWGAYSKALQLSEQHEFLKKSKRRGAGSSRGGSNSGATATTSRLSSSSKKSNNLVPQYTFNTTLKSKKISFRKN